MEISKNASCPCGSGEKYKKCCEGKLTNEQEEHFALLQTEKRIKDRLVNIAFAEFGKELLGEYSLNFNNKKLENIENGSDLLHFFEWFFLEAKHSNGEKILDFILENFSQLFNEEEISIIQEWHKNTQAGIFEVIEAKEKEWQIKIKEVFNNKEYTIKDRMASMHLLNGDIFYSRVQNIFGVNYLAGVAQTYPRLIFDQLKDYIAFHYENARDGTGISYEEFMNTHASVIARFEPTKPKFVSPEGDELKLCEQVYTILNGKHYDIMDWINESDDLFVITSVNSKGKKFLASVTIKAKENDAEIDKRIGRVMRIKTHLINPETGEKILSAGSIDIKGEKMKIFCYSEKVLNDIVKKMLGKKGIGNFVKLLKEDIELPNDILNEEDLSNFKKKTKKEEKLKTIGKELLTDYYKEWCDMNIPALGNITPRQLIKSETGKLKLKELFKDFENIDLHRKREGEDFVDSVKIIRDELKFYD